MSRREKILQALKTELTFAEDRLIFLSKDALYSKEKSIKILTIIKETNKLIDLYEGGANAK